MPSDIRIAIQLNPSDTLTEIDMSDYVFSGIVIGVHDRQAREATWSMVAPQHTRPLPWMAFIVIWDADDETQDIDNPLFEGHIANVTPGSSSNRVECTAYDATWLADRHATLMSFSWDGATTVDPSAVPRIVLNSANDNDDDHTLSRGNWLTVGQIIGTYLDDCLLPLRYVNAAPAADDAYESTELDALTTIPQEKVVFESAGIRQGIEGVLHSEPSKRFILVPGERKWHFWDLKDATTETLTLNDKDDAILSHEIHRVADNRYPAVEIYGPPRLTQVELTLSGEDLEIITTETLQTDIGTCCNVDGYRIIQIVDEAKWKMAPILTTAVDAQIGNWEIAPVKGPALLGYWGDNNQGQFAGWRLVNNWDYDSITGRIYIKPTTTQNYITRFNPSPVGGQPNYENPTDIKLIMCYYDTPYQVRYPEEDWEGTSYDATNAWTEIPLRLYDESLIVGIENGVQVTTVNRLAQFVALATQHHAMRKDVIYTGGIVLDGLRYEFRNLQKRVNLEGIDADGDPVTTNYSGLMVTDVSYDFAMQTTTLQFSSDLLEMVGIDPEQLKQRLGVRALHKVTWFFASSNTVVRNKVSQDKFGLHATGDTLQTTITVSAGSAYVDDFGNLG